MKRRKGGGKSFLSVALRRENIKNESEEPVGPLQSTAFS